MIEGVTLTFAVGLFAVVAPSAIGFAAALVGLPVASPIRTAALMGAWFAAVFAIAGVVVSILDLEWVLDLVPWVAAAAGVVLVAVGIRVARAGAARDRELSAAGFGIVFAIAALPGMLGVYSSLVEQGTDASGAAAAVGVTVSFGAGAASAIALLALASSALRGAVASRPLVGRAVGVLIAAAGAWIVVYWLPALFGGLIERGGLVEDAANDLSAAITEALARYELVFALVLLGISLAALLAAVRGRPAAQ